jgi:hypothetical protein
MEEPTVILITLAAKSHIIMRYTSVRSTESIIHNFSPMKHNCLHMLLLQLAIPVQNCSCETSMLSSECTRGLQDEFQQFTTQSSLEHLIEAKCSLQLSGMVNPSCSNDCFQSKSVAWDLS